jgi:O-antigen/teichoic acid export membrane protein
MSEAAAACSDGARARQRRRGGALAYLLIFLQIALALAYTPFMVHSLGKVEYGLFAIAGSLAAYLVILDMGLSDSMVRWLVGLSAKGNQTEEAGFLGSMLTLYGALGALVLTATGGLLLLAPKLFAATLDSGALRALQVTIAIVGMGAAATVAGNPFNATLVAHERFVFLRVLDMLNVAVVTAVCVLVLLSGGGIVAVVIVTATGQILMPLAKAVQVRYGLGIHASYRWPQRTHLQHVSSYAAPIFVSMLVELIFWKLDNIMIGALIGPSAVAIYAIGVTFNKYFMSFGTAISRVMMPDLVRRLDGGDGPELLTQRLVEISRWQALVLAPVLLGLTLFGQHFIRTWMGPGFELSYWVMVCTLVPYALELVGNVRNIVLQVKGLFWWRAGIFFVASLLKIGATLAALRYWGVVGAAACTGIAILLGYLGVALVMSRKVKIPICDYLRGVWRGILPALVLAGGAGAGMDLMLPAFGWGPLLEKVILFSCVYVALAWLLGVNTGERAMLREVALRRMLA